MENLIARAALDFKSYLSDGMTSYLRVGIPKYPDSIHNPFWFGH